LLALLPLLAWLALAEPIKLVASGDFPLVGAEVEVEKLDGWRATLTVGPEGTIVVREVPLGILKIRVLSWKGVPVNYSCTVTPWNATVVVPGIRRVTVSVVGARGQGIGGALVRVLYGDRVVEYGVTDPSGVYRTLLPSATYRIVAEYGGRRDEQLVDVGRQAEVTLRLDVFGEVGGTPISSSEFMLLLLLLALVPLALFVAAYEYAQWRRKRTIRVVAPPPAASGGAA